MNQYSRSSISVVDSIITVYGSFSPSSPPPTGVVPQFPLHKVKRSVAISSRNTAEEIPPVDTKSRRSGPVFTYTETRQSLVTEKEPLLLNPGNIRVFRPAEEEDYFSLIISVERLLRGLASQRLASVNATKLVCSLLLPFLVA